MASHGKGFGRIVRFGVFEADLDAGLLRKRGSRVRLQDKPFRILEALLERPGAVVSRQQLRERLWASDTFVDFDHGLDAAMTKLRQVLHDPAAAPRFVETLPRRGYRFIGDASGRAAAPPAGERVMLAVLPFRNVSGDPAQDMFTDGLTREMTIRLGRLSPAHLVVMASSTSLRIQNGDRRLDRIARELGADVLLEGDVRRSNGRVRISAQLLNAHDQTSLWGDSFDREIADEFDVQREVAAHVAGALALEILPQPAPAAAGQRRAPESVETYLRARYYLNRRTPEALRKALAAYEDVVAREPDWPEAHACVAETRALCAHYGLDSPLDALPKARQSVMRALVLDPTVPDGHTILAYIRHRHDWAWDEAESGFDRGLRLDPHCSIAHHLYAQFLSHRGRHDEAIATIRVARRVDPLSPLFRAEEACLLTNARRYEEAAEAARGALELDDGYAVAYHSLFRALHQLGRRQEAYDAARRSADRAPEVPYMVTDLGVAAAAAHRPDEAAAVLDRLDGAAGQRFVSPLLRARVLLALGKVAPALEELGRAVRERATEVVELGVDPEWDRLRAEPAFRKILTACGLRA